MAEKKANFVPVSALDKRRRSKRDLLRGLVRQAPFVAKNFQLYFRNAWRRHVLRTKVVAPYAVSFYVTHKCNLACSYCTQKEPDVFSDELPTRETIRLLKRIRKETDSIVITGGRADAAARYRRAGGGGALRVQIPFATAHYQWHAAGSEAADSASGDGTGGEPGCAGGRSDESALETGGAAESAGKSGAREGTDGQRAAHHHQHGDRTMERRRSRAIAGLVRRARIRIGGAVRADGENAESGAAAKPKVSGAGGQNYRPAAPRCSADQWHAA